MKKINTHSLVKSLLVSSTALCGIGFIAPPHALADDPYSYTTGAESPTTVKVPTGFDASGVMQYEYRDYILVADGIYKGVHVTNFAVSDTDPGSGDRLAVTLPNGKTQYLSYTLDGTSSSRTNLSATVSDAIFKGVNPSSSAPLYFGGALYNATSNGYDITASFVGNYVSSTSWNAAMGGAISNYELTPSSPPSPYIGTITGDFIKNYVSTGSGVASGGAIYNYRMEASNSKIDNINGDFIGNYATTATGQAMGGVIFNSAVGSTIGNISSNFIANYATATGNNGQAMGGVIYNKASRINTITGDFIGNRATATGSSGKAYGGVIYNDGTRTYTDLGTIGKIRGDFIGNYATTVTGEAYGGVIYNNYQIGNSEGISGKFVGNYANATGNGKAYGGVIYNNSNGSWAYISFTGANEFIGNYVKSAGNGGLGGGVIYNKATINGLNGTFAGNYAEATGTSQANGGVIYNEAGTINFTGTNTFTGNYAKGNDKAQGGVFVNGATINDLKGTFTGNYVETAGSSATWHFANGGVVYNYANTINFTDSTFTGNYANATAGGNAQGGVIHNAGGTIKFANTNTFNKNYAKANTGTANGGVIYNNGTITINNGGTVEFTNNYVQSSSDDANGGVIYNKANTINIIDGTFTGNYALSATENANGGAIYNDAGTINFTGTNTFTGNYAQTNTTVAGYYAKGGAIYNNKTITGLSAEFSGNYASSPSMSAYGGAIYNDADGNITFAADTTIKFTGNYVSAGGSSADGGAIYNDGTIDVLDAEFTGNKATSTGSGGASGGAIFNRGIINSLSGKFEENYTDGDSAFGGAIYNNNGANIASLTADFTRNYAKNTSGTGAKGGAIYTYKGNINFDGTNNFTDNYVQSSDYVQGGAIYNDRGTINITAGSTVNFSGNYTTLNGTDKTLNDIYNMGWSGVDAVINLYGTMNLDGGITGDSDTISINKLNVFSGANLGFKVKKFSDGTAMGTSADGTIITDQTVTFEAGTTIKFTPVILADNYAEGTLDKYKLFDGAVSADNVTFEITNELYDNITFDVSTGVFTFANGGPSDPESKIRQDILANGGSNNDATLANFLINPTMGSSSNENFNTVQDNVSELYQESQFNEVVKATKAMNPDEAPVISNASIDAVQSAFGIAGARLTGVFTPAKEVQKTTGKASGSDAKKEGVWAKGFYGQSKLKGDAGFKNKSWGIGVGFDHQFTPNFMLGVAYAYGQSDIDTDSRDIKAKTHTPVIYGEYKQKKWFIDGMLSYSFGKYDEKKSVTGVNDDVDYDVNVFGAQAIGGYAVTPWFIPEVGFRYFNVSQKDYTDNLGNNFDKKNANVFTGLIGAKFAKAFEASKGVNLVPELRLAASYDFVRDNNEVDVTLANMHSYTFKGEKLDRFGFEVDAGFKVDAGEFELAARYEGRFRNDFYNHTGLLEARYEF